MNKCLDIRLFSFRCPDIVWVIERSFYNCIVQDVKQVTESFADIDVTADINTDMLALAYHLDKLDKEWNISPQYVESACNLYDILIQFSVTWDFRINFRSLKNNSGYMFFILQVCFVNPVTPGVYLKVMHT